MRACRSGRNRTENTASFRGTPVVCGSPPEPRVQSVRWWALRALFAIALGVLWAGAALADPQDGELRLLQLPDDTTLGKGRLEIYHDGEWGAVCDDYWGRADAKVACRQLGYPGATTALRELQGPTDIPMWLDNMNCSGSETRLADCDGAGWGPHNPLYCSTVDEHAGVECKLSADDPEVLIAPRPVVVDEQASATYQVWLATVPSANVTVAIGGTMATDVSVDKTSLTFTTTNWSTPQDVTVTAAADSDTTDDTVVRCGAIEHRR